MPRLFYCEEKRHTCFSVRNSRKWAGKNAGKFSLLLTIGPARVKMMFSTFFFLVLTWFCRFFFCRVDDGGGGHAGAGVDGCGG